MGFCFLVVNLEGIAVFGFERILDALFISRIFSQLCGGEKPILLRSFQVKVSFFSLSLWRGEFVVSVVGTFLSTSFQKFSKFSKKSSHLLSTDT